MARPTTVFLDPQAHAFARKLWDTGLGEERIARVLLQQELATGEVRSVAQRIHTVKRREQWPAREVAAWDRYPPETHRRKALSEQSEERKAEKYAAALKLVRPDTPCAWCDCTRPGRKCVECGRRAPERMRA